MEIKDINAESGSDRKSDKRGDCSKFRSLTRVRTPVGAEDVAQKSFLEGVYSLEKCSGRYSKNAVCLWASENTIFLRAEESLSDVVEFDNGGILLDVNNGHVSSKKHGVVPKLFWSDAFHYHVGKIGIAGYSKSGKCLLENHEPTVSR